MMIWIAPSEEGTDKAGLKARPWNFADQFTAKLKLGHDAADQIHHH